jgi:predicted dehydrogenase
MGRRHLKALTALEKSGYPLKLAALCDSTKVRADECAVTFKRDAGREVESYGSLQEMLDREPEIRAVDVVTHPGAHHTTVLPCLEAKKHVLVEKPLGMTVRACRRMIEVAEKNNVTLAVEENFRRMPGSRAIKDVLERGTLGTPLLTVTNYINSTKGVGYSGKFLPGPKAWGHDRQKVGSLIMLEVAIHESDLLRYWFGEADEVFGTTKIVEKMRRYGEEVVNSTSEDTAFGTVTFQNGMLANESLSYAGHGDSEIRRYIAGSKGSLTSMEWRTWVKGVMTTDDGKKVSSDDYTKAFISGLDQAAREKLFPSGTTNMTDYGVDATDPAKFGLTVSIWDFMDSVQGSRRPEVDGEEGLKDVALSCAFLESGLANRPVSVREVELSKVDAFQRSIDQAEGLL